MKKVVKKVPKNSIHTQIKKQRKPLEKSLEKEGKKLYDSSIEKRKYIKTGVSGFDKLFENGIPKGSSILIAGGPGTGKTIFCLQTLMESVKGGKNACI